MLVEILDHAHRKRGWKAAREFQIYWTCIFFSPAPQIVPTRSGYEFAWAGECLCALMHCRNYGMLFITATSPRHEFGAGKRAARRFFSVQKTRCFLSINSSNSNTTELLLLFLCCGFNKNTCTPSKCFERRIMHGNNKVCRSRKSCVISLREEKMSRQTRANFVALSQKFAWSVSLVKWRIIIKPLSNNFHIGILECT